MKEGEMRITQVPDQIEQLEGLLQRLRQSIVSLGERLETVLREVPVDDGSLKKEAENLVPLATQLRNRCKEVDSMICQVEDIRSRVEL